jgi:hypothetical protein
MDLGNGIEINLGKVDFNQASDEELRAARERINAAGEARGLWVPEGAGQIAVAGAVDIEAERARLLGTVEVGAGLFNDTIDEINSGRRKKEQIPVFAPGLYREQAEDWLTDERVTAAAQLPETDQRRRTVFPKLNRPVSTEETVTTWANVSDHGLYGWSGRMKFLANWTADQLSGYDPELDDADRFAIIPTAYDAEREGTVAQQKVNLKTLQEEFPELDVTTIFEGSLLARKYKGQSRTWKDSYVRGIDLTPAKVGVATTCRTPTWAAMATRACTILNVQFEVAARLQVR